jgi:hypothetical protein
MRQTVMVIKKRSSSIIGIFGQDALGYYLLPQHVALTSGIQTWP